MEENIITPNTQVLLLGNGLLLSYKDGVSWSDLLKRVHKNDNVDVNQNLSNILPLSLEVVLRTGDDVIPAIRDNLKALNGYSTNDNLNKNLGELLKSGFDCILTTNYGFEIEMAIASKETITDNWLFRHQNCFSTASAKRAESKYSLRTFYSVSNQKIFHIHGELRKPSGIVLGHYSYGSLLAKYIDYLNAKHNSYELNQLRGQKQEMKSWLDAFIIGDVYMLGLGLDFSEMDLWWLINRRKRETATKGNIVYYSPIEKDGFDAKRELLRCYGVEVVDFGIKINMVDETMNDEEKERIKKENSIIYRKFYDKAIADINLRKVNLK